MQCSGGDGVYGKSGDWNHVVGKFCSPGGGTGPCCRTRGPQTLSRSCPGGKGAGEGMIILKQIKTRPRQSVPNSGFHLVGPGLILVNLV